MNAPTTITAADVASNELRAKLDDERRFQLARDVGEAFDLSLNCAQIARWRHPQDAEARAAFFYELRRDKMKAAGLPLEILGRFA